MIGGGIERARRYVNEKPIPLLSYYSDPYALESTEISFKKGIGFFWDTHWNYQSRIVEDSTNRRGWRKETVVVWNVIKFTLVVGTTGYHLTVRLTKAKDRL